MATTLKRTRDETDMDDDVFVIEVKPAPQKRKLTPVHDDPDCCGIIYLSCSDSEEHDPAYSSEEYENFQVGFLDCPEPSEWPGSEVDEDDVAPQPRDIISLASPPTCGPEELEAPWDFMDYTPAMEEDCTCLPEISCTCERKQKLYNTLVGVEEEEPPITVNYYTERKGPEGIHTQNLVCHTTGGYLWADETEDAEEQNKEIERRARMLLDMATGGYEAPVKKRRVRGGRKLGCDYI